MVVQDVLYILRMPQQPNIYVHRRCFAPSSHLVQRVLQMRNDEACGVCGKSVSQPVQEVIVQRSLFEEVV